MPFVMSRRDVLAVLASASALPFAWGCRGSESGRPLPGEAVGGTAAGEAGKNMSFCGIYEASLVGKARRR